MADGEQGWSWEQKALLVTIIIAMITAGIAIWGVLDARDNKDKLVESQQKIVEAIAAKDLAEQQRAAAEARSKVLKAENDKLGNVSIERLLALYDAHLNAINKAASKYDELSRQPDTPDTIPQKAAAEQDLYAEVASFVQFVGKWRDFAETLGKLLDGNVQQMETGRDRHSPDDIKKALDILRKSFPDLRQMLEVQLSQIGNG